VRPQCRRHGAGGRCGSSWRGCKPNCEPSILSKAAQQLEGSLSSRHLCQGLHQSVCTSARDRPCVLQGGVAALVAMLLVENGAPPGMTPIRCVAMGPAAAMSADLAEAASPFVTSVMLRWCQVRVSHAQVVPGLAMPTATPAVCKSLGLRFGFMVYGLRFGFTVWVYGLWFMVAPWCSRAAFAARIGIHRY
jgi:hypothetical protein